MMRAAMVAGVLVLAVSGPLQADPCGRITGLTRGFGGRAAGMAVVFASANLGGDSCVGNGQPMLIVPLH